MNELLCEQTGKGENAKSGEQERKEEMREFVGVKSFLEFSISPSLKREALIFNRIAIPDLCNWLRVAREIPAIPAFVLTSRDFLNELDWLREQGIAFEIRAQPCKQKISDEEYTNVLLQEDDIHKRLKEVGPPPYIEEIDSNSDAETLFKAFTPVALNFKAQAVRARRLSIELTKLSNQDAYPISLFNSFTEAQTQSRKHDVVQLSLRALPVPDDSTPWEQIIEYRSDPDSKSKFLALRHWMSKVARAELPPAELEEEIEVLIDQYQQHMRVHRMKTNARMLETVLITGAEMLAGLVSHKWSKAAQALLSINTRQVALLEGELTSPGRELAYIVKAREKFLRRD